MLLPTIVMQLSVGNQLGVIETTYQPMKIAAAEAQWDTCQPCSFSAFQIGGGANDKTPTEIIPIPHLLSVLATGKWNGKVTGLDQLQAQYEKKYGPGNYVPDVFIQYWSMRVMAYLAGLVLLLSLWGGWLLRKRPAGELPVVPACCRIWAVVDTVPDEHRGLAADRERPAAVDRAGPSEDRERELALGQRHRDLDQPDRVRPCPTSCSAPPTSY